MEFRGQQNQLTYISYELSIVICIDWSGDQISARREVYQCAFD